jgi:hypothetical protein
MSLLSRILIVVCCMSSCLGYTSLSLGADWKFYYQTEVEKENKTVTEKLYFDASSIERPQKGIVKVMQKVTKLAADEKTETDSKMRLIEMNCSSRKFRYLSVTEFEEGTGKALAEERTDNAPWIQFYLDSFMAGIYDIICFEKKQPKQPDKKADKQPDKTPVKQLKP